MKKCQKFLMKGNVTMQRTRHSRSEVAKKTMEEYEKSTGKKAKYPRSNRELEELQKEIHYRKSQPVAVTVYHDKEPDKITKQTRHQKVLKLIKDYEATFGRKPKYPRSNVELEQLQNDLERDKKIKLNIKQILTSF
ncbi:hypothetical protein CHS0354_009786 [Potamilus streckersoni]|uniref:Uncharacterized protein n=1 Tax=Potamilus streckersoni TaxID=2493646 RepID=A0AAE0W224_9BIVA|nr:hypothetical protein CHS0354_009786 [Potamilus streckersoni]